MHRIAFDGHKMRLRDGVAMIDVVEIDPEVAGKYRMNSTKQAGPLRKPRLNERDDLVLLHLCLFWGALVIMDHFTLLLTVRRIRTSLFQLIIRMFDAECTNVRSLFYNVAT